MAVNLNAKERPERLVSTFWIQCFGIEALFQCMPARLPSWEGQKLPMLKIIVILLVAGIVYDKAGLEMPSVLSCRLPC